MIFNLYWHQRYFVIFLQIKKKNNTVALWFYYQNGVWKNVYFRLIFKIKCVYWDNENIQKLNFGDGLTTL